MTHFNAKKKNSNPWFLCNYYLFVNIVKFNKPDTKTKTKQVPEDICDSKKEQKQRRRKKRIKTKYNLKSALPS